MSRVLARVLCLLALLCPAMGAKAEVTAPVLGRSEMQAEVDLLFKQILVNPKNLDLTFRYAELSSALGDYEAAIGALERMLFYNQQLPRVELELGLIYFRLGSYELARNHFEKAIAGADTPDQVRQRVNAFLREIARRISPNQYSVYGQVGLRYQTNANAGPNSSIVHALGNDATLSSQFLRKPDWNRFALISARYAYDFETQRGDTWESGITAYYSSQWTFSRLNLGLVEVETGPRLSLGGGAALTVHPYVLGTVATLADRQYLSGGGAGASLRWQGVWVQIEPGLEYRDRRYTNSVPYPTASDQSGHQWTGSLAASGMTPITGLRWQARLSNSRTTTTLDALSYRQSGIEFALPYEFEGFFGQAGRLWTLAPSVSFTDTKYGAPYFIVDPFITRRDRQWSVGTILDMSLWRDIGFATQVQYLHTGSNLPNYRTTNFVVTAGPTVRF